MTPHASQRYGKDAHPRPGQLLLRCVLLALAFAITTFGLAQWQARGFVWHDVWPLAERLSLHPVHLLVIGIAMIPPTLWEIFLLDQGSRNG